VIQHWTKAKLGDVVEKVRSIDPRKFPDTEFQYVDVSGISRRTFSIEDFSTIKGEGAPSRARRHIKEGDILFATIRPTLQRIAIVPKALDGQICSTGYFVLRHKASVSNRFMFYYLFTQSFSADIEARQKGASYPAVNDSDVRDQDFFYPSLPEQLRIVAILDEAFEGIDAAVANAEKNLANARELFESYLNIVFSQKGGGWMESTIGDACSIKSGTTVKAVLEKSHGEIPYIKVADMNIDRNLDGIVTSSRFLDKEDIGKNGVFPVGSTIFPKRGGAIMTNKKRITKTPICADLNTMAVIPGNEITPEYLYLYFLSIDMRALGSGSTIPQINNYDIAPLRIAIPSKKVQLEISSKVADLQNATVAIKTVYEQKLDALAELKQSILQKAFSGELTAHEAAA
jgi:type I restriction enzyme, S subunit